MYLFLVSQTPLHLLTRCAPELKKKLLHSYNNAVKKARSSSFTDLITRDKKVKQPALFLPHLSTPCYFFDNNYNFFPNHFVTKVIDLRPKILVSSSSQVDDSQCLKSFKWFSLNRLLTIIDKMKTLSFYFSPSYLRHLAPLVLHCFVLLTAH